MRKFKPGEKVILHQPKHGYYNKNDPKLFNAFEQEYTIAAELPFKEDLYHLVELPGYTVKDVVLSPAEHFDDGVANEISAVDALLV